MGDAGADSQRDALLVSAKGFMQKYVVKEEKK